MSFLSRHIYIKRMDSTIFFKLKEGGVGHYSSVKVAQLHEYSQSLAPVATSKWSIIRDILNASVLIAGAAYSLHYLYR
jgi:hypothetical protein